MKREYVCAEAAMPLNVALAELKFRLLLAADVKAAARRAEWHKVSLTAAMMVARRIQNVLEKP